MPKFHFIAVGGSAMHNLALTLADKGYRITGSDDVIYEPSYSRLKKAGILPEKFGWFPEKITPDLDGIIVGMHAKPDNPELKKALELGLPVYSYPEFLYREAANKKRVVIAGSHGKTTTTAALIHVLDKNGIHPDFMVGSLLEGFDRMVRITGSADTFIFEGDEYPTSPLDPRPKFLHYKPHIAVITGIALDHINVFKTWEDYIRQFELFIDTIEPGGTLIYFEEDDNLKKLAGKRSDIRYIPYGTPDYEVKDKRFFLIDRKTGEEIPLKIFGKHNMQNLEAVRLLAQETGIDDTRFYDAVKDFSGASLRLQKLVDSDSWTLIRDFAHAASKVRASVAAVRELYPDRKLLAVQELHTYSSLNKDYLPEYAHALDPADEAVIFYDPEALRIKNREPIEPDFIRRAYKREDLKIFTDAESFKNFLYDKEKQGSVWLLMSSGNLGGLDIEKLISGYGH